jgi:hypothetical protein
VMSGVWRVQGKATLGRGRQGEHQVEPVFVTAFICREDHTAENERGGGGTFGPSKFCAGTW